MPGQAGQPGTEEKAGRRRRQLEKFKAQHRAAQAARWAVQAAGSSRATLLDRWAAGRRRIQAAAQKPPGHGRAARGGQCTAAVSIGCQRGPFGSLLQIHCSCSVRVRPKSYRSGAPRSSHTVQARSTSSARRRGPPW